VDLHVSPAELRLAHCLTTGQVFSWHVVERDEDGDGRDGASSATERNLNADLQQEQHTQQQSQQQKEQQSAWGVHDATEWVGPLGPHWIVSIRQTPETTLYRVLHEPTGDHDIEQHLRDYFQLDTIPLSSLYEEWSQRDDRLKRIAAVLPGVRLLRQDPVECLLSFICSSNNNVPRITQLLAKLRKTYGRYLMDLPCRNVVDGDGGGGSGSGVIGSSSLPVHSFPTLEELRTATDEELRALGFGYRAPYLVETCDLLHELGGRTYLSNLRSVHDADQVQEELLQFKGVGRKVADCVALFSLDQAEAIPVDTHVWHIACREYDPTLADARSLTPTVYRRVGSLFRSRFGSHAGWAHSLLFVAELPSFRSVLPEDLVAQMDGWREQEQEKKAMEKRERQQKASSSSSKNKKTKKASV